MSVTVHQLLAKWKNDPVLFLLFPLSECFVFLFLQYGSLFCFPIADLSLSFTPDRDLGLFTHIFSVIIKKLTLDFSAVEIIFLGV